MTMAPPTFMGLTGRPLSLMVSTVATTGFVLFGYDQGVMVSLFAVVPTWRIPKFEPKRFFGFGSFPSYSVHRREAKKI